MTKKNYTPKTHLGCKIYVRQFIGYDEWEYLTVIKGEIYTANVTFKRPLYQRLLGMDYTASKEETILNYVISMAHTTIESVLNIK